MLEICSMSVLVLHETLLVLVLIYGSETMLWRKEKSKIRDVQMDNLRGWIKGKCTDKGVVQG